MPKTRQDPVEYVSKVYINFNGDRPSFLGFAPLYFPSVYTFFFFWQGFFRLTYVCP